MRLESQRLTRLFLLLALLAGLGHASWSHAATRFSVASGLWGNSATWSATSGGAPLVAGGVPVAGDTVTIERGFNVTVNVAGACGVGCASIQLGGLVTGNGTLTFNNGTSLTVAGIVTLGNGARTGSINMTAGGTLTVQGFTLNALGAWTPGAGTLELTANNTLPNNTNMDTFNNLTVDGGTTTLSRAIAVSNNLSISAGTLDDGDFQIAGNGTGTLSMGPNTTLIVGNGATARTFPTLFTNAKINLDVTSTVVYAANAAQTISSAPTYGNLKLAPVMTNNRIYTIAGVVFVNGDFTIDPSKTAAGAVLLTVNMNGAITLPATKSITIQGSGAGPATSLLNTSATNYALNAGDLTIGTNGTLTANASTITLNATSGTLFTRAGTFNQGTSTVALTSAGDVTLNAGAITFATLTVNMPGFDATLDPAASITIATKLNLTNGTIITGAASVIAVAASCSTTIVARTNGWVNGNLQKRIPATLGTSCTFEVGGASQYAPVTIAYPGTPTAGNITASTTDGDHPSIAASTLDPSLTVNRYWTVNSPVALGTYNITLNFGAGDRDTDTQPTTLFSVQRFNQTSTAWGALTTGTRTLISTQATGVVGAAATVYDFAVGEAEQAAGTGSFNAVENLASATAGKIFTKLAGTAFTLDLVALNAARNAIDTTFKGAVKVELLNSSSGGALDGNGCNAGWGVIQTLVATPQFLVSDSGRRQNVSITENNAWPNVRVRVSSPATGAATLIGCSTDNFSIRPLSFTSVTSNMTNTGTSSTPSAIAGSGLFTLVVNTGLTGYTGIPKIDSSAVQAHVNAKQTGAVGGTFIAAAVSGTATGTNLFTYSEVGNFRFLGFDTALDTTSARGVYDDSFTTVDAGDCTNDFSNTPTGGKYGCKFGIIANTAFFGRFYPKDFLLTPGTLTNRRALACAPASAFTYAGEQFRLTFTLTARNGAGIPATTQNYDPVAGFDSFNGTIIGNFNFGAVDSGGPTALTLTPGTSSGVWASGAATFTADLMLTRPTAAPNGPFDAFKVGIDPSDADSVKLSSYNLDTTVPPDTNDRGLVGTTRIRFGQLQLMNAHGSQQLDLTIPMEVQYYNGSVFQVNALDSCTTLPAAASGSWVVGNYVAPLSAVNTPTGNLTVGGAFVNGTGSLRLGKPSPTAQGSADVTINLGGGATASACPAYAPAATAANLSYLRGKWCGANYDKDPLSRATFGIYSNKFIYLRENY